mmetsp:Transcript_10184/g.15305  ORF Transcript_10184/g.15305 Transcript_10184/m.15305 type:complete len:131 (+) Transcript_10184:129-521(+)
MKSGAQTNVLTVMAAFVLAACLAAVKSCIMLCVPKTKGGLRNFLEKKLPKQASKSVTWLAFLLVTNSTDECRDPSSRRCMELDDAVCNQSKSELQELLCRDTADEAIELCSYVGLPIRRKLGQQNSQKSE